MKFPRLGFFFLATVASLTGGCGKGGDQSTPAANQSSSGSVVAAPVNYVGTAVKGEQAAFKTIDTVSLNEEVQLFNAQEGRLPKSLDELVEKNYLHKLPEAPAGQKIVYDSAQGKVSVVKE